MKNIFIALLVALAMRPTIAIAQSSLPVPQGGVMHDIPGAHELPDPAIDYKIVFDIRTLADTADKISPALEDVAKLINTFHKYGVPADHMHLVAVFHGQTIVLVANDTTYKMRTGWKANPNVELLKQLDHAGVSMVVCGQSALAQNYDQASLLTFVQTDLSATVAFINLQSRGYVKVQK